MSKPPLEALTPEELIGYADGVVLVVRSLEGKDLRPGAFESIQVSINTARLAVELAEFKLKHPAP